MSVTANDFTVAQDLPVIQAVNGASNTEIAQSTTQLVPAIESAMANAPIEMQPPPGLEETDAMNGSEGQAKTQSSQLEVLGSTVCTLMAQVNYLQQQLEERSTATACDSFNAVGTSATDRVTAQWVGGPSRKKRAFARARAHWLKLQQKDDVSENADGQEEQNTEALAMQEKTSAPVSSTPLRSSAAPFLPGGMYTF